MFREEEEETHQAMAKVIYMSGTRGVHNTMRVDVVILRRERHSHRRLHGHFSVEVSEEVG
jgi:hypothetical protein